MSDNQSICHHCSARIPQGVTFCTRCGKSLESAPLTSPPTPEPSGTQDAAPAAGEDTIAETVTQAPIQAGPQTPFSLLGREIEYLDQQFPWNLISLVSVWAFLFLTYFV